MKRILACLMPICLFFISPVKGLQKFVHENSIETDDEQLNLKQCFIYSNLLGYNILSVSNPELYKISAAWIGTPYKYGGHSKKGIDCSGFVTIVYRESFNKNISGSAGELCKSSKPVNRSDLQEGDFVFFKIRKKRVSHVGIYLGQNKFVHASLNSGVIISDLEEPYYAKYFYKGGRI